MARATCMAGTTVPRTRRRTWHARRRPGLPVLGDLARCRADVRQSWRGGSGPAEQSIAKGATMSGKAQPKARIFPPRAALMVLRTVPTRPTGWPMKLPASSASSLPIAERHTDHELVRRGTRTREVLPSRSLQRPPTDTLDLTGSPLSAMFDPVANSAAPWVVSAPSVTGPSLTSTSRRSRLDTDRCGSQRQSAAFCYQPTLARYGQNQRRSGK
jgi:hypothetical protein